MLSENQRHQGYGTAFALEAHPAVRLSEPLAAELAVSSWFFPSTKNTGRATLWGAGLRFDPRVTARLRLFADAHAGLGVTGGNGRFMFDTGAGLEYAFNELVSLGVFGRYGQVTDSRVDPKFVAGGALVALAWPRDKAPPPPLLASPPPPPVAARAPIPAPPAIADADHDGVPDRDDRCPTEAQGATPDPARPGCPDGDDDKDGVSNTLDRCREQPAGPTPDAILTGCPQGPVTINHARIELARPIAFAPEQDVILEESFPVLEGLVAVLRASADIKKVSIEGHTEGQGDADKNLDLSRRRAESVRRWLTEHGVESGRLEAKGFGDTRPIATNKTAKGRAENRRIEVIIVDPPEGAR